MDVTDLRVRLAAAERERDEERAWRKVAQAGCAANEADFLRAEARFFVEVRKLAAEKARADAADRCWREAEAALATERIAGPQHPDALTDLESKYHHACKRAAAADADVARLTAERDAIQADYIASVEALHPIAVERDAALAMVAVLEGYCLGHKARVAVLEGALRTIERWDMLHPCGSRPQSISDGPWLLALVRAALAWNEKA